MSTIPICFCITDSIPSWAGIASIAIGYRNPTLIHHADSTAVRSALVNRPAQGNFPLRNWADSTQHGLIQGQEHRRRCLIAVTSTVLALVGRTGSRFGIDLVHRNAAVSI